MWTKMFGEPPADFVILSPNAISNGTCKSCSRFLLYHYVGGTSSTLSCYHICTVSRHAPLCSWPWNYVLWQQESEGIQSTDAAVEVCISSVLKVDQCSCSGSSTKTFVCHNLWVGHDMSLYKGHFGVKLSLNLFVEFHPVTRVCWDAWCTLCIVQPCDADRCSVETHTSCYERSSAGASGSNVK